MFETNNVKIDQKALYFVNQSNIFRKYKYVDIACHEKYKKNDFWNILGKNSRDLICFFGKKIETYIFYLICIWDCGLSSDNQKLVSNTLHGFARDNGRDDIWKKI